MKVKFKSSIFTLHGVTLMSVAYMTGINYRTLTRLKNNKTQCSIENAFKIARCLNINIDDLFEVDYQNKNISQIDLKTFHQLTIDD